MRYRRSQSRSRCAVLYSSRIRFSIRVVSESYPSRIRVVSESCRPQSRHVRVWEGGWGRAGAGGSNRLGGCVCVCARARACVCMFVCIYVGMQVCVYACMHVRCMHVCMYARAHARKCVCAYVRMHVKNNWSGRAVSMYVCM